MAYRKTVATAAIVVLLTVAAHASDPTGKWEATFNTQIGEQKYTYEFKAEGEKLTGKAVSQYGESQIQDGTVKGDDIAFIEMLNFQGQPLGIAYTGKISGDEIKFTRKVGDVATEELTAKRVK